MTAHWLYCVPRLTLDRGPETDPIVFYCGLEGCPGHDDHTAFLVKNGVVKMRQANQDSNSCELNFQQFKDNHGSMKSQIDELFAFSMSSICGPLLDLAKSTVERLEAVKAKE